jgi:hypothetical protein
MDDPVTRLGKRKLVLRSVSREQFVSRTRVRIGLRHGLERAELLESRRFVSAKFVRHVASPSDHSGQDNHEDYVNVRGVWSQVSEK